MTFCFEVSSVVNYYKYYHSRKTWTSLHLLKNSQNSAKQKPKCSTWKVCYIVFNARNIFTKDYKKAVDPEILNCINLAAFSAKDLLVTRNCLNFWHGRKPDCTYHHELHKKKIIFVIHANVPSVAWFVWIID